MKIGFIGLGGMGTPIVVNLLRAGHQVTVWNRSRAKVEPLLSQGAVEADTPAATAGESDLVMTAVADDGALEVLTGTLFDAPIYRNCGQMLAKPTGENHRPGPALGACRPSGVSLRRAGLRSTKAMRPISLFGMGVVQELDLRRGLYRAPLNNRGADRFSFVGRFSTGWRRFKSEIRVGANVRSHSEVKKTGGRGGQIGRGD